MSVLDWIHNFDRFDGRKGIKPGLERMEAMLARLGNPHQQLKFLHVAGTNGKGSTCAYLASILEAAGYRVGLFTSPYMTSFHDRMVIGGRPIPQEDLEAMVERLRPVVDEISETECGRPTEFEVVTTLSLLFYEKEQVDFVVWETGLGGRLDSTNVVTPLVSLITNVGHDHIAILGGTLEAIAAEKAGIIKPGVPVITTAEGVAEDVIVRKAEENGSPYILWKKHFSAHRDEMMGLAGQTFDWDGMGRQFRDLRIRMLGAHQIFNASLAVAACVQLEEQGVAIGEEALREGLARTQWAGRLEVVREQPLTLLDGAHNPEGAQVLGNALRELVPGRRIVMTVGILVDKAIPEVLQPLVPLAAHVIVTRPDIPRAADNAEVARVIREIAPHVTIETTESVSEALERAEAALQGPDDCIVCTGSLYTISEIRAVYLKNPLI